ncbi:hypothetical protein JW921_11285 [Candidatus Fermentibacterales bacterium]|nr:hypothetical protein [Candidatus Fermentibacterales bacterium]
MTWEDPRLVGLGNDGTRGFKLPLCFPGVDVLFWCEAGAIHYDECWPGGGKHVEICVDGSLAD